MSIKDIISDIISDHQEKENSLDIQEAHNLWESLKSRYDNLEELQIYETFMHDLDFEVLSQEILDDVFEEQINQLETKMNQHQIALPSRPPKSVRTNVNTEVLTDRFIAAKIIAMMQTDIDLQIRAIRTSITTEQIRNLFCNFLKETIYLHDKTVKYLKTKGWLGIPPQYPYLATETKERVDAGEAFHLIDHLITRYDAVNITQIYHHQAHDSDFKYILEKGLQLTLETQINSLEEEINYFGLPQPARPPKSVKSKIDCEELEDEIMFRELFASLSHMLNLHANGFKQNATNDRIRKLYIDFLDEEVKMFSNLAKYGKTKGWSRPIPMFNPMSNELVSQP
jgi:spore coat protein CotF